MESVKGLNNVKIVTFGMKDTNDYYPTEMNEEDTACEDFTLTRRGEKLGRVNLIVPGEHNMLNAIAAAAAAHCLGVEPKVICSTLGKFTGVHRRFEVLGKFEGVTVADDFAHHPTELTAVLTSAMKMATGRCGPCSSPTPTPAPTICWRTSPRLCLFRTTW